MIVVVLCELLLAVLVGTFLLTQFVVPLYQGTKILPIIRKDKRNVEHEIVDLQDKLETSKLIEEVEHLKDLLENSRKENK